MIKYIIRRFISALFIVLGVLTVIFFVMQLAPGDPSSIYLRPEISPETVEMLRNQMGLNEPIWKQYLLWIKEFIKMNFGFSYAHMQPVRNILGAAILNTLQLTLAVFVLQLILGIILGVYTALHENSRIDHFFNALFLFFYSIPSFWLALMLILFFSLKLGWLPSSQMKSFTDISGILPQLIDRIKHLILPAVVLSLPIASHTAKYVRSSLIEVLKQDYIRTAKAYGLNKNLIIYKYALKNALLPVATFMGLYLPFILGGTVIIENIFAWPGMGRVTINAIFEHDYPLILASNFIAALAVVTGTFISDILYLLIDPRIRLQSQMR